MRNRLFSFLAAAGCDPPGDASDALRVFLAIDNRSGYKGKIEDPQTRELVLIGSKNQSHYRYEEYFVTVVEYSFPERHVSSSSIGGGRILCSSCKNID